MPITPLTLLHTSVSGMLAHQFEMDVTSDNLSNINTLGFKPSRADFQELIAPGALDTAMNVPYRGTAFGVTRRSTAPGPLTPGDSPLELAIQGNGFFAIRLPDGGTAYTRDGHFMRDSAGDLVTASGGRVIWQGALPPADQAEALHVNPDGTVMALTNGQWNQVGTIQIDRFANPSGLTMSDNNLLLASVASGPAQAGTPGANGLGQLISGVLEGSAANIADEMSNMVLAQRAYGLSLKAFQQADEMIGLAIRLRGG